MHVEYQRFGGLVPSLMNKAPRYSVDLSGADADEVRRLVPPGFYDLHSSGAPSRAPDAFRYEILIDDDGRHQHVTLSEDELPPSLQPLIDWLQRHAEA